MADEKGPEGSTVTVDAETAKKIADLETKLAAETAERAKLESIRTDMETSRQAAKDREKKALEEQGQFKALSESLQEEVKVLKAEIETLKAKEGEYAPLKAKAEQWDGYETETRKELMEQIPEDERPNYEGASLALLRSTAKLLGNTDKGGTFKGQGKPPTGGSKPWKEMTPAERDEFTAKHLNDPVALRKKIQGLV